MYGTSKIRSATQVGGVPGRSGATCKANVLHPGVLGYMAITEDRVRMVLPDCVGITASGSVTVLKKSVFPSDSV